jgi:hypothetical protein
VLAEARRDHVERMPGAEQMTGRELTDEEKTFCARIGLTDGYDVDDDLPQQIHICWPYHLWWGALCKTPRLWGHGGGPGLPVTCEECLRLLPEVMKRDPELLDGIARLNDVVRSLQSVDFAASEFTWSLDHPEEYARVQAECEKPLTEARTELDAAMKEHDEQWAAIVAKGHRKP